MTLYGAISNLVMMREHPMMPSMFYSSLDKIIETVSECEEPETNYSEIPNNWIPCSERLPEEDYWLGGSGKQFSDEVLVSVSNSADEDVYVYVSQTLDGKWNLELPEYYEVIAWMPLPEPYQEEGEKDGKDT
jgi:hypothetical protein